MLDISRERFEELVDAALDLIPAELAARVHNLVVLVEDEPPAGEPRDLLGLYDGRALTDSDGWGPVELPNQIFIFRNPLLAMCASEEELVREVEITVVHEVAHHFGIDDRKLHEMGYG